MERYTFSSEQLDQYFDRIALPMKHRTHDVSSQDHDTRLAYLSQLLKHQIGNRHPPAPPAPQNRPVKGRGGYCLEVNTLFHTVLRSLGFHCYQVAGRVWVPPEGKWTCWDHVANIIVIGNVKYLCDVGFGPRRSDSPNATGAWHNTPAGPPAESRLVYETLPQGLSDTKLWIYQHRSNTSSDWIQAYCFSETELLPDDLEGLNYAPWIGRTSNFARKVICVRFSVPNEILHDIPDAETIAANDINGALILNQNNFKYRWNGEDLIDESLPTEEDRLNVLRERFGIELDEEDRRAIMGTVSALATKK